MLPISVISKRTEIIGINIKSPNPIPKDFNKFKPVILDRLS